MVLQVRKIEFSHVTPVEVISGLRELFRSGVHVQAVGQIVANGLDVAANPPGGLEHGDVVAAAR
jgi:hypothetical protein